MASVSKHWWGFQVKLNHREACNITDPALNQSAGALANTVAGILGGAVAAAITAAVVAVVSVARVYIRGLNVKSGGKGVILKFLWPATYEVDPDRWTVDRVG